MATHVDRDSKAGSAVPMGSIRPASLRGTQSFLTTLARCWRMPSLLGLELLWRWAFGIPAVALLYWQGSRILSSVSLAHTGIEHFSLIDTAAAAQIVSQVADILLPHILRVALWLGPLLAITWSIASGFGRSAVLRRYENRLLKSPRILAEMQLLRIAMLCLSMAVWFVCLRWAAWSSLSGADPDLVVYFTKAIFISFAVFSFWAVAGWVFSIAPLLALLEGTGVIASLRASLQFGRGSLSGLRPKLIEINLVLGIVKVALIVLAMVFCATPVPFKEEMSGWILYAWWAAVTIAYFAASDFFQLARLAGYIDLWRATNVTVGPPGRIEPSELNKPAPTASPYR